MGFTLREYDLRNTFQTERNLLSFLGLYPRRSPKMSFLYFLGRIAAIFLCVTHIISCIIQMKIDINNLEKFSESFQYFITLSTYTCNLANFAIYRKRLLQIEDFLTSPAFYGHSDDHLKLLKQKIAACKIVVKILRFLCVAAVVFYAVPPFLDPQKSNDLPITLWFPYDVTNFYYATFVFEMMGIANTAYGNSTIDVLTWMLMNVASGQFDILKENLKSIDYEDLETAKENFKLCVQHHKAIIKLVSQIERMFSKGIFLQFFASVVAICFIGFMMIGVPAFSMQFVFLVVYFLCMMWQIAVYCWYGHDIITTSSTIGESFYVSNWYESDIAFRKNVVIFLEKVKKSVSLTAGFVPLSLITFTSILKSSYFYFAVLERLYIVFSGLGVFLSISPDLTSTSDAFKI